MENINCVLCNSNRNATILVARDPDNISQNYYYAVKCDECGLVFTNPRPSAEELSKFYSQQYYGRLKLYPFNLIEKALIYFQRLRVQKIKRLISKGRILDVGCGRGMFLKALLREGFDVYGLEPSLANQQEYERSSKELNISCGEIKDILYPALFFDVITLWHVFEHVYDPRELLREIKRILKPQGTLIMAMPNFRSLEAMIAKKRWFHLDLPRHLYHYTPLTLEKMLKTEGFEITKKDYFSFEFGPFGLLQTVMNIMGGEFNFLAKILKNRSIGQFRTSKGCYSLGLFIFFIPFLPLILIFSLIEALCHRGGIIEIYAKSTK